MSAALLESHFRQLEKLQAEAVHNNSENSEKWRNRLIDIRREMQAQINGMGVALSDCSAKGAGASTCQMLRGEISKLRSALALHQATWPAVAIDVNDPSYRSSLVKLRGANEQFRSAASIAIAKLKAANL